MMESGKGKSNIYKKSKTVINLEGSSKECDGRVIATDAATEAAAQAVITIANPTLMDNHCLTQPFQGHIALVPLLTDLYTNGLEVFTEPLDEDESLDLIRAFAVGVEVSNEDPVTYTVVTGSTIRRKDNLVDSLGFKYTMKVDKRRSAVTWRCSSRCAKVWCKATVVEKDGVLTRGPNRHSCSAEPGRQLVDKLTHDVKRRAMRRPLDTAVDMAEEFLIGHIRQLDAHVTQLKNLLAKAQADRRPPRPANKREFDFTKFHTRHVALRIAYIGCDLQGYAVQEDTDRTVEAELFDALQRTRLIESRETSNYHRCGRTDKGVSAFSQAISIDLRTNLLEGVGVKPREAGTANERKGDTTTEINYVHLLNKVLPPEIRVLAWCPVDPDFSARFSCTQRTYKYFFPKGNLNLQAMREAAQRLEGPHDFRNLCKMDIANGVVNYTRNIFSTDIAVIDDRVGGYSTCELTVVGKAFLWHQIRCVVAVLLLVGQGREKPTIVDTLLDVEANPRKPQYTMASELPLVLFDCQFEDFDWIYDTECHLANIKHFQELWTKQMVRSVMIKRMLDGLDFVTITKSKPSGTIVDQSWGETHQPVTSQPDCLIAGNKTKLYKPLLHRQKCESLENRLEHQAKRQKTRQEGGCEEGTQPGEEEIDDCDHD